MNHPWLVFANLLAAFLAFSGIIFYVLVYTHWLKRHSTQNIVIGGAAGAIPALVGWAGSSHRYFKLGSVANFCHCLPLDTSPFLGFSFNDS